VITKETRSRRISTWAILESSGPKQLELAMVMATPLQLPDGTVYTSVLLSIPRRTKEESDMSARYERAQSTKSSKEELGCRKCNKEVFGLVCCAPEQGTAEICVLLLLFRFSICVPQEA